MSYQIKHDNIFISFLQDCVCLCLCALPSFRPHHSEKVKLKWAKQFALDQDTAHPRLILSRDGKQCMMGMCARNSYTTQRSLRDLVKS